MSEDLDRLMADDDTIQLVAGEVICRSEGANLSLGRMRYGLFAPTTAGRARLLALASEPEPKAKPKAKAKAKPKAKAKRTAENQLELALDDTAEAEANIAE